MQRMLELVNHIRTTHPKDDFFADIEHIWQTSVQALAQYEAYDSAFQLLDAESWFELKAKATAHFRDHRAGQLKQGFFNQLNEAFAYEHLTRAGCTQVRILKEVGKTTPDISYNADGKNRHCEVKTIGISDDQIARQEKIEAFSGVIYERLSNGYLQKLIKTIAAAEKQIAAKGTSGTIYIITLFDDFTHGHYETYETQISETLATLTSPFVAVRVGVLGNKIIEKGTLLHT
jgi:hypothetical protein